MFIVIIQDKVPTLYGPYPSFAHALVVAESYLFEIPKGAIKDSDETYKGHSFSLTIVSSIKIDP